MAHKTDEFCYISNLEEGVEIYTTIAEGWCVDNKPWNHVAANCMYGGNFWFPIGFSRLQLDTSTVEVIFERVSVVFE